MQQIRRHPFIMFCAVAAAAALAACNAPHPKEARVEEHIIRHALWFNAGATQPAPADIAAFDAFLHTVRPASVSYVLISANDATRVQKLRLKRLEAHMARLGIDADAMHVQHGTGDDRFVLVVLRYAQGVPPANCPDLSESTIANYNNTDYSNTGCAYENNLAVQVANPEDLVRGHGQPDYDGDRESVIIQHYMTDTAQPSPAAAVTGVSTTSTAR